MKKLFLIMSAWLSAFCPLQAEENVAPGINRPYQNPEFSSWQGIFESPGREVYDKRREIIAALNLKPGMKVADIGAGTGLHTFLIAEQVGEQGKVFAVDISENFIQNIRRLAEEKGLKNVTGIVNSQKSAALPENSVDLIFICNTYHHFEYPHAMLASLRAALRPGGEMVIVDYHRQPGSSSSWVMHHVRAGRDLTLREVTEAGFELREDRDELLRQNYFLRFGLPNTAPSEAEQSSEPPS